MAELQINEGNPMTALAQLLAYSILSVHAMREAVKLMEWTPQTWKIRKLAEAHMDDTEIQLKIIGERHTEISARLKEIGY